MFQEWIDTHYKFDAERVLLSWPPNSLPPQGFHPEGPPEAKFRGGILVARAYIKESTYSWNMQSVYPQLAEETGYESRQTSKFKTTVL